VDNGTSARGTRVRVSWVLRRKVSHSGCAFGADLRFPHSSLDFQLARPMPDPVGAEKRPTTKNLPSSTDSQA